ncbi:hypothetical protein Q6A89_02045 [Aliarcobacter skirrowii]|uniref:hypothetical protein n=1 Tax=Aliarcobacter skirrowii TaxID=28200 RepID=UPI0029BC4780|nr:hypothetical protein [Aliarcobacter skirrowii]MDX4059290.1 hypothetical protein [Aliarcobacter skirrowii]
MKSTQWIKIVLGLLFFGILFVIGINYFINPYGLYNSKELKLSEIRNFNKMNLVKISKVENLKPTSIILGTSRAEFAYNPEHDFFMKPSFNFATAGSSLYENRRNLEWAILQGNLKQVLLVADYRMFISLKMKQINDFDDYFSRLYKYTFLLNLDTLNDSFEKIINKQYINSYLDNGQRNERFYEKNITERGGTLSVIERQYVDAFSGYNKEYKYNDNGLNSFYDFIEIVELCYKNNIELTIVFGSNHVELWESLDNTLGFDNWLNWKKDVVLAMEKIAQRLKQKPFEIVDFSIYNEYTKEVKTNNMKFHWELVHYKQRLGDKILDFLNNKSLENIGVKLNANNIDTHLINLKSHRAEYLDDIKNKEIQ